MNQKKEKSVRFVQDQKKMYSQEKFCVSYVLQPAITVTVSYPQQKQKEAEIFDSSEMYSLLKPKICLIPAFLLLAEDLRIKSTKALKNI